MSTVVFTGPTLPAAEVRSLLPAAEILAPVRHGDLLRLDLGPGDQVLIIDGLFLQTASVRHREILYLLERGVTVAGSSSMGALRAAELWPYGMRGYGEVFRLYRDGEIDGDDEVAVIHGTADDGYRTYSEPLAAIRVALREAAAAQVIPAEQARMMLNLAASMPFRSRSFRALESVAAREDIPAAAIEAFRAWRSSHDTDVKAADARLMLAAAAAGDQRLRPHGRDDQPIRGVHMWMFEIWEHRFHGGRTGGEWIADADADAAIRLIHPEFPQAYRRHVLARITGMDPAHPALVERASAIGRAKGLRLPDPASDLTQTWLTAADLSGTPDEAFATLLARAFGVSHGPHSHTKWTLPVQFRTPVVLDWAREFAATVRRYSKRPPGEPHGRFRPDAIDRAVATLWDCDIAALDAQSWDRGIGGLADLRRLAEPFVACLKACGPEALGDIPPAG
jgi:hypothetical protein